MVATGGQPASQLELTYSATVSACCGSGQASAVGCKGVVRVPWFLFFLDSTIPGGFMMVKLEATAQVTLPTWCYILALNRMFSPSTSRLSP